MAGLLAVGIAILLAIVISVSYALVLRELRQINANLEQLIGLLAHDEARSATRRPWMESTKCLQALASFSTRQTSRPALPCWLGLFISRPEFSGICLGNR